jgi:hypothetical protein
MERVGAYSGILTSEIGGSSLPIFMVAVGMGPAAFRRLEVFEKKP